MRVVKIGGAALTDAAWLDAFAAQVARAATPLVIVHGGGPAINELSDRLGIPVKWSGGRRVTTAAALDVASMVLSGRLNKRIVGRLVGAGADALGMSGEDGGLVSAEVAQGGALGLVGQVVGVRVELLERLVSQGMVPVLSPICRGENGEPLNVNADEVAAAVAVAVRAPELLFVTDVAGVRDGAGVMRAELEAQEARALIAADAAKGGMAVKLEAALTALSMGVGVVRIGQVSALTAESSVTRIRTAEMRKAVLA
jgi:acetylglutamate kinase